MKIMIQLPGAFMKRNRFFYAIVITLPMLLMLLGCGGGRPSRVPVSGKVLLDGKPLMYGTIVFVPNDGRQSTGTINNGNFTLTCFQPNDGAIVGKHKIWITSSELQKNDTVIKYFIPPKYGNVNTSGLEEEIKAATDSLVINLTWKGNNPGAPFTEPFGTQGGDGDDGMRARIKKNQAEGKSGSSNDQNK